MKTIQPQTISDLEFDLVLDQVSQRALTQGGKAECLAIKPMIRAADIERSLKEVEEFMASIGSDQSFPGHHFDALTEVLHQLSIENSVLELNGFKKIKQVCLTTDAIKRFLKKFDQFYVVLNQYANHVPYDDQPVRHIDSILDRFGQVKDNASEELLHLRKSILKVKSSINKSFSQALSRCAQADYLDEIRESVVDNKRVLAVKAMHRKKVNGVMMGQSKTGSIVYIEPQQTLEYAQELSALMYQEIEEVKRLLKWLTDALRPYISEITQYESFLIQVDLWYAKAHYAKAMNAVRPKITSERELRLIKAYHPLLFLDHQKQKKITHPQSITLNHNNRIIVISGPNAGGKSITLKTVGLLQLMTQSGLLIPVDPTSELCLFKRILTDIGDHQSIENHLSTYSYRLKQMNYFLKKCQKDSLFLIDEFGTGSDPELGGALAETFLEEFYTREAFGIITTHYTNLKLLANELPNASNANMLFDAKTLEPLYQLFVGEAGSSYTFEVAQKNGIPFGLINRAKKKIAAGKVRFDKTIASLQKDRSGLRNLTKSLKEQEQSAMVKAQELADTQKKVQEKLERYQEVFDANQRLVVLGRKVDQLAERYFNKWTKKGLMEALFKLVMQENSKRTPKAKLKTLSQKEDNTRTKGGSSKKQNTKKAISKSGSKKSNKTAAIDRELKKEVENIRKAKKAKKQQPIVAQEQQVIELIVGDRVRMIDGVAVGTIDKIEKNKVVVNYGTFTTNVKKEYLEKV
ncbi:MAG: DNA mismatch repair protein MutS [Flavobacteriaceae bacterium]|nr:DNA mismatch repair protein MutS [Flavobacteriaceae bacterium]